MPQKQVPLDGGARRAIGGALTAAAAYQPASELQQMLGLAAAILLFRSD